METRKDREVEILKGIRDKLLNDNPSRKKWLFPLYPTEYQKFSRKRESKWCIGEHSLIIHEYEDTMGNAPTIFSENGNNDEIEEFLKDGSYQEVSMQIHGVIFPDPSIYHGDQRENEVSLHIQTYGGSSDCDHIYPTFTYRKNVGDDEGMWICCDEEYVEPMVLVFDKYFE